MIGMVAIIVKAALLVSVLSNNKAIVNTDKGNEERGMEDINERMNSSISCFCGGLLLLLLFSCTRICSSSISYNGKEFVYLLLFNPIK